MQHEFPVAPRRFDKRLLTIGVVVALIALVAAWYWGSPRWSLHQMKSAAEAGNSDKFATYIDFPALRVSMKEEINAQLAAKLTKPDVGGFAAIGAMFAGAMVDRMIDGFVTPAGMRVIFLRSKQAGSGGPAKVDATSDKLVIDRQGFDQFLLHDPTDKAGGGLVFKRDGLGWKLVGMHLPA